MVKPCTDHKKRGRYFQKFSILEQGPITDEALAPTECINCKIVRGGWGGRLTQEKRIISKENLMRVLTVAGGSLIKFVNFPR